MNIEYNGEKYDYEFDYEFNDGENDESYESDDIIYDDDIEGGYNFSNNYKAPSTGISKNPNVQVNLNKANKIDKNEKQSDMVQKFQGKIQLDKVQQQLSHQVKKDIKISMKSQNVQNKVKDKKDRATVEQVLDPRTRVILVKLMNNGIVNSINGCISTGKEANVYYATSPDNKEYAIKIYKTSILVFKDRDKYVAGEFRFRNGHCKSNPRKMIKMWAEKEIRNLKRIYQSDIPCPNPILIKSNVLLMEFIGKDGIQAPRLKDAEIDSVQEYAKIYQELLKQMRILYHDCKLIHADLSEYNLLYFKEVLYMIDVSQSIEHDHPSALEFLRRDILNVNLYFKKQGVLIFGLRQCFDFITKFNVENMQTEIEEMINYREENNPDDEKIFAGVYIPRTLGEVSTLQAERDINKLMTDQKAGEVLYSKMAGIESIKENTYEYKAQIKIEQKQQQLTTIKLADSERVEKKENGDNEEEEKDKEGQEEKKAVSIKKNTTLIKPKKQVQIQEEQQDDVKEKKEAQKPKLIQFKPQISKGKNSLIKKKIIKKSNDSGSDSSDSGSSSSSDSDSSSSSSGSDSDSDNSDSDDDEDGKDDGKKDKEKHKHGWDPFEGLSKAERKQKVKQEKRDKRAEKMKKSTKKRLQRKNKKK